MIYAWISIYGLVLGSFFHVVGLRVPVKQSILFPRSTCLHCGRKLQCVELIPVLSYVLQKGRCRKCKERIHLLYPLTELMTSFLFTLSFASFGFSFQTLLAWTLCSLLVTVTVSDLTYKMIPDRILGIFFLLFFVERCFFPLDPWWDSLVGAGVAFVLLAAIAIVSDGGMGGGDVKLFAVIGFAVGTKMFLLAFFLATCFGTLIAIIGMAAGKLTRKSAIPFAPFIAAGTVLSFFFYQPIMRVYLSLFS